MLLTWILPSTFLSNRFKLILYIAWTKTCIFKLRIVNFCFFLLSYSILSCHVYVQRFVHNLCERKNITKSNTFIHTYNLYTISAFLFSILTHQYVFCNKSCGPFLKFINSELYLISEMCLKYAIGSNLDNMGKYFLPT